MITKITKFYIREYSDNGQTKVYAEWIDHKGRPGRTEGDVGPCSCCGREAPYVEIALGTHMTALRDRAKREGVEIIFETW